MARCTETDFALLSLRMLLDRVLTRSRPDATFAIGSARRANQGNAVRLLRQAIPRLPPQL